MRTGGQFACEQHGEADVHLSAPTPEAAVQKADDTLTSSWDEALHLEARLVRAHTASGAVDEVDLADVRGLQSTTVLGVACAALERAELDLAPRLTDGDVAWVDEQRAVADERLSAAEAGEGFMGGRGHLPLAHPTYHRWAGVVPVAAPVPDVDGDHRLRVALVHVEARAIVGRVTLPSDEVLDASGRLDTCRVVDAVEMRADAAGGAAGRVVDALDRSIPPF